MRLWIKLQNVWPLSQTIADLQTLQPVQQASIRETMQFIELASTLMTSGASLWTLDKRLSALVSRFNIFYSPALH